MLEDNAIRAITIGVGVFVVLITLTAIIAYVNVAREMATAADKNLNTWDEININNIMDYTGNVTIDVKGIDFINFIRRYVNRDNIRISIGASTESISDWQNEIGNASEEKLMEINPNAEIKMTKKVSSDGEILIEVRGDIYIIKDPVEGLLYGDVNLDGTLTIEDFNLLKSYLDYGDIEHLYDINGDGEITIEDGTLLYQYSILPDIYGEYIKSDGTLDLNNDGKIDANDAFVINDYLELKSSINREAADINIDRFVDVNDLNRLRAVLIANGIEVPEEE